MSISTDPLSIPTDQLPSSKPPGDELRDEAKPVSEPRRIVASLLNWALVGAAAALLMSLIELIDLNVRLAPELQSFADRAVFSSFFSLNLVGGLAVGFFVGLLIHTASLLKRGALLAIVRSGKAKLVHELVVGAGVAVIGALCLNQQPQIHAYAIGIIVEAEKVESLTEPFSNHRTLAAYLLLVAIVVGCLFLWRATRWLRSTGTIIRAAGILVLVVVIACAYYVDSRFETPLYDNSIHLSMFLLSTALSMSLISTIFSRLPDRGSARKSGRKALALLVAIVLTALVAFSFASFDNDQNLKTQLFSRTTQAKQYFNLTRWALDFDRDGYSSFLGGGDCDDRRADINPGRPEIVDTGIDHNCIGGALTHQGIADWHLAYSSLHRPPDASARRFNVIYIFIDALRADHLSAYGYARNTSPNLDKLAARSSLFENAFTPAPNTFEAMPKFTQGAYWDAHLEAWPSIMGRNGYDALLFPRRTSTIQRYVKGLRVVESSPEEGRFKQTINAAIELFGSISKDRPFCAYFYSNDPHMPYRPHAEFDYGSSITDLYDGEISYLDFHLGRLFDFMDNTGLMDNTMIVIMSDHGESLGERGVYKHSTQLYNEQTRVPMIVHVPGLPARSIKDYVSTIDLGPTMLNAVGLDYPKECAGVSLLPLMRGEPFTHPPVYGEQTQKPVPVRAIQSAHEPRTKKYMVITQDGFKLIYNRDYSSFELFDLRNDPSEIHNLFERLPEKAAEMRESLGRYVDVLTVSRPWDADESQFSRGPTGERREAK